MKKTIKSWEEQQRIKNYNNKIRNAKSSVNSKRGQQKIQFLNDSKQFSQVGKTPTTRHIDSSSSGYSSATDYMEFDKDNINKIPLYKLLNLFNLQQYAKELINRGYGFNLAKFNQLNSSQVEHLLLEIKCQPTHKNKFLQLIEYIGELMPQLSDYHMANYTPIAMQLVDGPQTKSKSLNKNNSNKSLQPSMGKKFQSQQQIGNNRRFQNHPYSQPVQQQQYGTGGARGQLRNKQQTLGLQVISPQYQKKVVLPNQLQGSSANYLKMQSLESDFFMNKDDQNFDEFKKALDEILKKYQDPVALKQMQMQQIQQQQQLQQQFSQQQQLQQLQQVNSQKSSSQQSNAKKDKEHHTVVLPQINRSETDKSHKTASVNINDKKRGSAQDSTDESCENNKKKEKSVNSHKSDSSGLSTTHTIQSINKVSSNTSSDHGKISQAVNNNNIQLIQQQQQQQQQQQPQPQQQKQQSQQSHPSQAQSQQQQKGVANKQQQQPLNSNQHTQQQLNQQQQQSQIKIQRREPKLKQKKVTEVQDDINLTHEYINDNKQEAFLKENKIIKNLKKNISKNTTCIDDLNPNLDYDKYKHMYQSYDSGQLTSTLVNLDIEELCFCLACALIKHIEFTMNNQNGKVNQLALQSDNRFHSEVTASNQMTNMEEIKEINNSQDDMQAGYQQIDYAVKSGGEDSFQQQLNQDQQQSNYKQYNKQYKTQKNIKFNQSQQQQGQQFKEIMPEQMEYSRADEVNEQIESDVQQHESSGGNLVNKNEEEDQYQSENTKNNNQKHNEKPDVNDNQQIEEQQDIQESTPNDDVEDSKQIFEQSRNEIEDILKESIMQAKEMEQQQQKLNNIQIQNQHKNVEDEVEEIESENDKEDQNENSEEEYQQEDQNVNQNDLQQQEQQLQQKQDTSTNAEDDNFEEENQQNQNNLKIKNISLKQRLDMQPAEDEEMHYSEDELDISRNKQQQHHDNDNCSNQFQQQNQDQTNFEFSIDSRNVTMIIEEHNKDDVLRNWRHFQKTFYENDDANYKCSAYDLPTKEVISNYCKNIIITSKMEKEVPIIALIYIERLLIKSGFGLDVRNWRKITFTALILGSKIWDDESFENENFSKAFPTFQTKEINEMERVFLNFISYNLYIKSYEYAKYYFILRTFAEKGKKSFPLRPLDLKTIIYLQRNSNKAQRTYIDMYKNPNNKSFQLGM